MSLEGKVAVVTGGSRGLGRQIVLALAAEGVDVVVASRKLDACETVAAEARDAHGVRAEAVACHAGRWAEVEALAATTLERMGRWDILVNNAGMSPLYDSLADVSEELFDKVMGVNFKGPFRLAALAGEHMAANGGGVILNISSVAAVRPTPHELVYAAAKSALNTMTVGMAQAYGPTVRVNTIMPGAFRTTIAEAWDMAAIERDMLPQVALGRIAEPEEIVGAAMWLLSDASSYATGTVVRLDGGWLG